MAEWVTYETELHDWGIKHGAWSMELKVIEHGAWRIKHGAWGMEHGEKLKCINANI